MIYKECNPLGICDYFVCNCTDCDNYNVYCQNHCDCDDPHVYVDIADIDEIIETCQCCSNCVFDKKRGCAYHDYLRDGVL